MADCFHFVKFDREKCEGCGTCIDKCPMHAIRLRDGKAVILEERCIDCGECIRTCPTKAKTAVTDAMEALSDYTYRIALLAPSLQVLLDTEGFAGLVSSEDVEDVFKRIGFSEVFQVGHAAEVVAFITEQHILQERGAKPMFSSSCPAVLKLIHTRFPDLLKHAAAILSPMEVAARLAKEAAMEKTGLSYEEIGAFFISPCPAKVSETKRPILITHSTADGAVGVNLVYKAIVAQLSEKAESKRRTELKKGKESIDACCCSEVPQGTDAVTRIKVSGVRKVISLLEAMKRGRQVGVDFVELLACTGGCLGGPLNPKNPLEQAANLGELIEKYRTKRSYYNDEQLFDIYYRGCFASTRPIWQA